MGEMSFSPLKWWAWFWSCFFRGGKAGVGQSYSLGPCHPLLNSAYYPRSLQAEDTERPQILGSVVLSLEAVIPDWRFIEYCGDMKGSQAPSPWVSLLIIPHPCKSHSWNPPAISFLPISGLNWALSDLSWCAGSQKAGSENAGGFFSSTVLYQKNPCSAKSMGSAL